MIFSFVFVFDVQSQDYITGLTLVSVRSDIIHSACHIAYPVFLLMTIIFSDLIDHLLCFY